MQKFDLTTRSFIFTTDRGQQVDEAIAYIRENVQSVKDTALENILDRLEYLLKDDQSSKVTEIISDLQRLTSKVTESEIIYDALLSYKAQVEATLKTKI